MLCLRPAASGVVRPGAGGKCSDGSLRTLDTGRLDATRVAHGALAPLR